MSDTIENLSNQLDHSNNANNKILTIAIPTYNRSKYLVECLEHVLPQIGKEECDVEILVSDNASTDDTPNIMEDLSKKYPCLHYIRNGTNVGPDRNFLNCLQKAKGRFVHLLSDDDILLPGSVSKIKECIISNPDLKLIFLNLFSFLGAFDPSKKYSKHFKIDNNMIYDNPNKYIEDIQVMLTFVSALVFNKESFKKIFQPEKYVGTNLLQAHLAFQCISQGKNALISHVCIAGRRENSGGYDFYKVFVYEWSNVLFKTALQTGFSRTSLKKIYRVTIRKHVRSWTKKVRLENARFRIKRSILFKYTWSYPEAWICVYPYAFWPKGLLVGLQKIEMFFKKMRKKH